MITRLNFLFELTPDILNIIAIIGALTALVAAFIALVQNDIKKVLAYSTVSQLGLMFLALGFGAYEVAIFHVITHAFFKACLFLGSGSVIHGLQGEQDIKNMGGLKSKMKVSQIVFLIGTLAIVGCPPFAGFFSKDEILASVYSWSFWGFVVLAFSSVFTAWYMFRLYFSTFHGNYRGTQHTWEHAHESPWIILFPLLVLAFLSIIGGFAGMPEILSHHHLVKEYLKFSMVDHTHTVSHLFEYSLWGITVVALLIIGILSYRKYSTIKKEDFEKEEDIISKILANKYYLDEIYSIIFSRPLKSLGSWFKNVFERNGIDIYVKAPGALLNKASLELKPLQSGNISWYMISILLGFLAFAILFIFKF